jgi:glycosyltransferase involved in cell wall biosynthesis
MKACPGSAGKALIVVENNSVPFDRRVWREAQTLRDAGWQVSVISPKKVYHRGSARIAEDADYELLDRIHIYRYQLDAAVGGALGFAKEYLVAFVKTFRLMLKVWRERGFDILQVCNPPDFFFPLGWFCRLFGRHFIFDHHDLVPESVAERWHGRLGAIMLRIALFAERMTMRTADAIISTNESYRKIAIERDGISPERIFVVRNGPVLRDLRQVETDISLKKGRRYLVGYLGIMGPQDGLVLLMEAIRITIKESHRHDIQFVLVGDGPLRQWLIDQSRAWDIEEFVTSPGMAIGVDEWIRFLSSPDLCVAPEPPTTFNDHSTMVKIAEYMAMGQPIVAFDLKETRYTAQDAAVYVRKPDPAEFSRAMLELLDDPARRGRMAEYGQKRAREYLSWETQEPILLDAYSFALKLKRPNKVSQDHGENQ